MSVIPSTGKSLVRVHSLSMAHSVPNFFDVKPLSHLYCTQIPARRHSEYIQNMAFSTFSLPGSHEIP